MRRQELYEKAKTEVEKRRLKAEKEAAKRREELERTLPELREMAGEQSAAGAAAAALAAAGNTAAAQKKLAEMRALAQKRAKMLQRIGWKEADLAPRYTCEKCADTGRANGVVCVCVQEEVKRLRRGEINESGPLALCRFETFVLEKYPERMADSPISPRQNMRRILQDCQDWAEEFGPHSQSLYLFGDAGLGKTHLALAMAAVVLDKGYDVLYVSAQKAFAAISADRYENGDDLFASMLAADLLVLDDLGTEYLDAYVLSRLYELVNTRSKHPTIYTTNIWQHGMLEQRYTEKIASRLLGDCHPMRFLGVDIRLQKD